MDIKNIKKIIDLMKANELSDFEMEEDGFRLAIRRKNGNEQILVAPSAAQPMMVAGATAPGIAPAPAAEAPAPAVDENAGLEEITSPIVGTFYRSSSPDAEPFVTVGQEVDEETVVCIVEAMKVMNEIKAETKGVIKKILIDNATPVQFGQAMFLVEPR